MMYIYYFKKIKLIVLALLFISSSLSYAMEDAGDSKGLVSAERTRSSNSTSECHLDWLSDSLKQQILGFNDLLELNLVRRTRKSMSRLVDSSLIALTVPSDTDFRSYVRPIFTRLQRLDLRHVYLPGITKTDLDYLQSHLRNLSHLALRMDDDILEPLLAMSSVRTLDLHIDLDRSEQPLIKWSPEQKEKIISLCLIHDDDRYGSNFDLKANLAGCSNLTELEIFGAREMKWDSTGLKLPKLERLIVDHVEWSLLKGLCVNPKIETLYAKGITSCEAFSSLFSSGAPSLTDLSLISFNWRIDYHNGHLDPARKDYLDAKNIRNLSGYSGLRSLDLSRTIINNRSFDALDAESLPYLRFLSIFIGAKRWGGLTPKALGTVSRLRSLVDLKIEVTDPTPHSLDRLNPKALQNLRRLELVELTPLPQVVSRIKKFKKLTGLKIWSPNESHSFLDEGGLANLSASALKDLRNLSIVGLAFKDQKSRESAVKSLSLFSQLVELEFKGYTLKLEPQEGKEADSSRDFSELSSLSAKNFPVLTALRLRYDLASEDVDHWSQWGQGELSHLELGDRSDAKGIDALKKRLPQVRIKIANQRADWGTNY